MQAPFTVLVNTDDSCLAKCGPQKISGAISFTAEFSGQAIMEAMPSHLVELL